MRAALDALHHDAASWDEVADVTRRAARDASDQDLTDRELSWAAGQTALLGTYQEIQAKTVRLLTEAATVCAGLSTALDQVAVAYETSDGRAAAALRGVWDVHE
ncbi:hypothetical protein [Actinoplanes sp. NPDC051494]|uniref:hypothetical protein n=1 Tax=Actinoplanes sp. NPDC051494 TaxID=3363907 RepID=UPI0037B95A71